MHESKKMVLSDKIDQELHGEPEQPVDIGTLSLIVAVAVAVLLVCIITGWFNCLQYSC